MSRTFRLAVLECDTPIEEVKTRYGPYSSLFRNLLLRGLEQLPRSGVRLEVTGHEVVTGRQYPSLNTIDGLLLTGEQ